MIINQRNIRIDSALRAAVKIGALSSSEYDEACRLITDGELAASAKAAPSEHEKAMTDAVMHGAGFMKDGKHVPLDQVHDQPDERAAFEAHLRSIKYPVLPVWHNSEPVSPVLRDMWRCWQARAAHNGGGE